MPELQNRLEIFVAQLQCLLVEVSQGRMKQVILMPGIMKGLTQVSLACKGQRFGTNGLQFRSWCTVSRKRSNLDHSWDISMHR